LVEGEFLVVLENTPENERLEPKNDRSSMISMVIFQGLSPKYPKSRLVGFVPGNFQKSQWFLCTKM